MTRSDVDPEAVRHCPRCGADYRAGFTTCSDCGIALVPGPAEEEAPTAAKKLDFYQEQDMRNFGRTFEMFDQEEGKPVAIALESEPDLGLLIGKFESEGIGARPGPMDMTHFPRGVFGGSLGGAVRGAERWVVLVREPNAERAKAIWERFAKIQDGVRRGSEGGSADDLADGDLEGEPTEVVDSATSGDDAWAEANGRVWGTQAEK